MSDPQPPASTQHDEPGPATWRTLYALLILELALLTIAGLLLEWWATS